MSNNDGGARCRRVIECLLDLNVNEWQIFNQSIKTSCDLDNVK